MFEKAIENLTNNTFSIFIFSLFIIAVLVVNKYYLQSLEKDIQIEKDKQAMYDTASNVD